MYSLNLCSKNVLITPDECMALFNGSALDPHKWMSAIQIAEERFVRPLLGYNFYEDLIAQKNVTVTTGNIATLQAYFTPRNITLLPGQTVNAAELPTVSAAYANLWNQFLWKYVYECVYLVALPENYAQFTTAGVIKNNPISAVIGNANKSGDSVGIDLKDVRYLSDKQLLERINPMQTALEQFLCINKSTYPLYAATKCDQYCHDGKVAKRTTAFVDVYNDEDERRWHYEVATPAAAPAPVTKTCSIVVNIKSVPDTTALFMLCNLQTIRKEYPAGNTLTIPQLAGKTVIFPIYIDNNVVMSLPFNNATGTYDNTANGGFADGSIVTVNYNENV